MKQLPATPADIQETCTVRSPSGQSISACLDGYLQLRDLNIELFNNPSRESLVDNLRACITTTALAVKSRLEEEARQSSTEIIRQALHSLDDALPEELASKIEQQITAPIWREVADIKDKLLDLRFRGSGGALVTAEVNGWGHLVNVEIDDLVDLGDRQMACDLIYAAIDSALKRRWDECVVDLEAGTVNGL